MINYIIGGAVAFAVFRGLKAGFSHNSCGSCSSCKGCEHAGSCGRKKP